MSIKDKLEIILITYNREKHVEKTFNALLAENSPVKDFEITVLDNNSTDHTCDFVSQLMEKHSNIKYAKNSYNVGISGNIAKAMEKAKKEYVWIICDDDKYDFSNWSEVEKAITQKEQALCIARYAISDEHKNDTAYQLLQMTFIPAIIFKTSILNDTVMRNAFDNIYTLFPHLCPITAMINQGKNIYVLDKAIVENGMDPETTDSSYTRGLKTDELYQRTLTMGWIVGYANILSILKDKNLIHRAMMIAIETEGIHNDFNSFIESMKHWYFNKENWMQLLDVYLQLDQKSQQILLEIFMKKQRTLNNLY